VPDVIDPEFDVCQFLSCWQTDPLDQLNISGSLKILIIFLHPLHLLWPINATMTNFF